MNRGGGAHLSMMVVRPAGAGVLNYERAREGGVYFFLYPLRGRIRWGGRPNLADWRCDEFCAFPTVATVSTRVRDVSSIASM